MKWPACCCFWQKQLTFLDASTTARPSCGKHNASRNWSKGCETLLFAWVKKMGDRLAMGPSSPRTSAFGSEGSPTISRAAARQRQPLPDDLHDTRFVRDDRRRAVGRHRQMTRAPEDRDRLDHGAGRAIDHRDPAYRSLSHPQLLSILGEREAEGSGDRNRIRSGPALQVPHLQPASLVGQVESAVSAAHDEVLG